MPDEKNNPAGCEIVSARNFNYTKELIFKAWPNPYLKVDRPEAHLSKQIALVSALTIP